MSWWVKGLLPHPVMEYFVFYTECTRVLIISWVGGPCSWTSESIYFFHLAKRWVSLSGSFCLTSHYLRRIRWLPGELQRIFLSLTIPTATEHDSCLVLLVRLFIPGRQRVPPETSVAQLCDRARTDNTGWGSLLGLVEFYPLTGQVYGNWKLFLYLKFESRTLDMVFFKKYFLETTYIKLMQSMLVLK